MEPEFGKDNAEQPKDAVTAGDSPTEQLRVQKGAAAKDAAANDAAAKDSLDGSDSPTVQIPVQRAASKIAVTSKDTAAVSKDAAAKGDSSTESTGVRRSAATGAAGVAAAATGGAAAGDAAAKASGTSGGSSRRGGDSSRRRGSLKALRGSGGSTKILISLVTVVAVVLAGVGWWLFDSFDKTRITAYFDKSIGIYQGSEVRILGVPVGKVDSITPMGDQVKVVMSVDRKYDIPADASAAQITPSVVSDRYIQLAPVYKGGPKMGREATIPKERTATPVEVDRLYKSIAQLSDELGPNGANKNGAVNQLVETGAKNLAGNGDALANSLTQLSHAARYLSDARGDIFGTIKNLQVFVHTLAVNDAQVRQFNTQLADLAGFLSGERHDLGQALNLLSVALGDVARFIDDNRDLVASNAASLTKLTQTLANQRNDVANLLPVLPLALSNLINVHDGETGTLDMRANFTDLQNPFGTICKLLDLGQLRPGDPKFDAISRQMGPILSKCKTITDQIKAGVVTPTLNLPFGILSGENLQRAPVPGTVPGTPSNQQPPSQKPGGQK